MTIICSPTERGTVITSLKSLASSSKPKIKLATAWTPETLGLDYAWVDPEGNYRGVQRKEIKDFLASLADGRLAREAAQMVAEVAMPILVIEGRISVSEGNLSTGSSYGRKMPYTSFVGQLLTLMDRGIEVMFAAEAKRTADIIVTAYKWSHRTDHTTGRTRPKPAGDWGSPTNRDWQVHMLQGIDGIGVKMAEAILDTLGRCPIRVDATVEELTSVPGIGKRTAQKIIRSLNGEV